ncbi:hypothetical protein [Sorangium sp. So ce1000]
MSETVLAETDLAVIAEATPALDPSLTWPCSCERVVELGDAGAAS